MKEIMLGVLNSTTAAKRSFSDMFQEENKVHKSYSWYVDECAKSGPFDCRYKNYLVFVRCLCLERIWKNVQS